MEQELMPYSTILSMVDNWQTIQVKILKAFELLEDAEKSLKMVFNDSLSIDFRNSYGCNSDSAKKMIESAKRRAWQAIVNKSEMRRFLSIKRTEEIDNNLEKGELPDLTTDEIQKLVKSAMANVYNFADEMVVEVFDYLRPHNSEYWNNQQFSWELGEKVILGYAVEEGYGAGLYHTNYNRDNNFRALDNVFHALDGKGFSASYYGELHDAINTSATGEGETEYFKFKCHKNRNLHLTFKRMDLVAKMNGIASKNILKPKNAE